jgi:hypothetical protein
MAKMINPELEVVRFENEDVIATSYRLIGGVWYSGGQEVDDVSKVPTNLPNPNNQGGYVNPSDPKITNGRWIYSNGQWIWVY